MAGSEAKLDKLLQGVADINAQHATLEKAVGTAETTANINFENTKKEVEKIVSEMQQDKQAAAAKAQEQKDSYELLQKEIILLGNGNGSDHKMKGMFKEYDDHLARYFRKNIAIPEAEVEAICHDLVIKSLYGAEDSKVVQEAKDLVAGSNTDGGFFLTTDRSSKISTRIFSTSPMRAVSSVESTSSDVWEMVLDDDEADAGWVGEIDDRPKTDTATVGLIKVPIHELYANPKLSQKIIDDAAFDIVSWHQRKVTSRFGRLENTAFVKGPGAAQPKGFLTYPAWSAAGVYERGKVEQAISASSGVVVADDLISVQGLLEEEHEMNAEWGMNRNTLFNNVFKLKDTQGQYLINPRLVSEGGQMVLLGRPINLFQDMVNVTNSSLSIAIADWREFYTIVDRMGIRVLRDPFTLKPYVLFYTTKRVGGAVTNYQAGKILKTKA